MLEVETGGIINMEVYKYMAHLYTTFKAQRKTNKDQEKMHN